MLDQWNLGPGPRFITGLEKGALGHGLLANSRKRRKSLVRRLTHIQGNGSGNSERSGRREGLAGLSPYLLVEGGEKGGNKSGLVSDQNLLFPLRVAKKKVSSWAAGVGYFRNRDRFWEDGSHDL